MTDNLRAVIRRADDNDRAVIISIQAREQAEPVGIRIFTTESIISHFWELPQLRGGNWLNVAEDVLPDGYRVSIDQTFLNHPLIIGLEFDSATDPIKNIRKIEAWDGSGGAPSVIYLESKE